MYSPLFIWFAVWIGVWTIFNTIVRWPTESFKSKKYFLRAIFFIVISTVLFLKINGLLIPYKPQLFTGFLVSIIIGTFLSHDRKYYKKFTKDKYFLVLASFNLFFQQIMVVWGILILLGVYGNTYRDYLFGIMFFTAHILLIFAKWSIYRYQMLLLTFFGGILFSFLVRNFTWGIIASFLIHFFVYIFWLYKTGDEEKI
jgi:hypothetical protein